MSSNKRCCVPGCYESGGMHQALHCFPNPLCARDRFNTWLYAIGGDIIGLENNFIFKYRRVCHRHFEEKYFCRNNRLSNIAIPTQNMPGIKSPLKYNFGGRQPMREIQNIALEPSCSLDLDKFPPTAGTSAASMDLVTPDSASPLTSTQSIPSTSGLSAKRKDLDKFPPTAGTSAASMDLVTPDSASPLTSTQSIPSTSGLSAKRKGEKIIQRTSYTTNKKLFLTDAEAALRRKIIAVRNKLSKCKNKIRKQTEEIKAAKKFSTNPTFLSAIENCSNIARLLMQIQWRESKKMVKGRRFSLEEKIAAISILKQSPKGYRFLRKVFILPAPQTLIKLLQQSNVHPGINKNIFSQLKTKASKMKPSEKLCILLFDEISLKPSISYSERKGQITGFVDNGEEKSPEFASHALVFMIRGLVNNYKQAVAFTFAASATKGPELAKQIKCIIVKLLEAGFVVVATICDQGTNNRQALKVLIEESREKFITRGETPKDKTILIENQEIFPLYDPPHLLKGVRNNLLVKDLKYTQNGSTKIAKWAHLEILQKENPAFEGIQLIPKLTECHTNPEKLSKMKVKFASQIFSRTVASNMGYLADKGIIPMECRDTASLLLFMDNLFDSMNGSYRKNGNAKPLLKPARPHSVHHKTWAEGIEILKTMKFINKKGREETVPSINNWVWTLEAIEILLNKLNIEYGIDSVWMRHLNQDPLENFFGAIRSHGCRNNNPTCGQFQSAFISLLINNLYSVHTHGKNCENDFCEALMSLVIDNNNCKATSTNSLELSNLLNIKYLSINEIKNEPKKLATMQYISGYFLYKTKTKIFKNCFYCNNTLFNKNALEYLKYREYAGRRWLCSPSEKFIQLIFNCNHIINIVLKQNLEKSNLKESILTLLLTLTDFNFINCLQHKQKIIEYLMNFVIKFTIITYCKNINKIFAGRIENYDDCDIYQIKAMKIHRTKYFKKYK